MAGTGAPAPFGLPPLAAPAGDDLLEEGIRKLVFLPGGREPGRGAAAGHVGGNSRDSQSMNPPPGKSAVAFGPGLDNAGPAAATQGPSVK